MSRNFELMQQAGLGPSTGHASEPRDSVLASGSNGNGDRSGTEPAQAAREELLKLVQRVFLVQTPRRSRAVVFADIDSGDGCARLCAEAAKTLAHNATGQVCLIDANLHSDFLPRVLGATTSYGLADSLHQPGPIRKFTQKLGPDNLSFISLRSSDGSSNFLSADGLKARIEELLNEFEYLLFNAPSVIVDGIAVLLGPLVDGVILVVEANSTHREVARKAKERLESASVRLLGAVFNNRTFPIPAAIYLRL